MKLETKINRYYAFKFLQNAYFFGAVLVPFYTTWAGMNQQTVMLIQSWFLFCVTFLELPTGLVADRFGRRASLITGAVSATIGLVVYGLLANIYLFLLGEFILALAISFYSGADEAWIIDTLNEHADQKRKTEVIGKGQSFMFLGMILGSLTGSLIASYVSINATMYLSALPTLILLLTAWHMPEPKVHKAVDEVFRWRQGISSLQVLINHQTLRQLSLNLILVALPAYFVIWLYQPLLQRIGIDVAWFGTIHALFIGMEILITYQFGWLEQRLGLVSYLGLSAILTSFGFFIILWKLNLATILVFVLTAGSFGLSRRFFAVGHFHDFVDPTYRTSISSSFSLLMRLSTAIVNVIVGWLFVRSPELTLLILGVLPLIAVIFVPLNQVFHKK